MKLLTISHKYICLFIKKAPVTYVRGLQVIRLDKDLIDV